MGPVFIGVEVQRNTDGDTPSNPLNVHLQYICNIPAKCQMDRLNALGGDDFMKNALSPIIQYHGW